MSDGGGGIFLWVCIGFNSLSVGFIVVRMSAVTGKIEKVVRAERFLSAEESNQKPVKTNGISLIVSRSIRQQ